MAARSRGRPALHASLAGCLNILGIRHPQAAVLAMLSLVTRRNSRHPLLIVGLFALGIMFLSWRIMPQTVGEHALTISQAFAIVEHTPMGVAPNAAVGSGIYLGLVSSAVLVAFGLTIVLKRVSQLYLPAVKDDDV